MQNRFLSVVEESSMKPSVPKFEIGDTVDVHVRILEGDKERIQIYNGVVIARSGSGTREMFIVRRIVQGEGVERKFPIHSPRIADIVVKRSGKVRRAKLYYLRERHGKAAKIKEKRVPRGKAAAAAEAVDEVELEDEVVDEVELEDEGVDEVGDEVVDEVDGVDGDEDEDAQEATDE
jgi:large subunit ribosomal protein L19